jgi:hypothetical protein
MKKITLLIIILLIPAYAWAEYTIFLRNGAVITNVRTYYESNGDITVYFQTGAMMVPGQDILRIEEVEAVEEEPAAEDTEEAVELQDPRRGIQREPGGEESQGRGEQPAGRESPAVDQRSDKNGRFNEIKAELNTVYSEFRQLEEEEARLVAEINEKRSGRAAYNKIQLIQIMKETEPLEQELFAVQQRKDELRQTRNSLEDELRTIE